MTPALPLPEGHPVFTLPWLPPLRWAAVAGQTVTAAPGSGVRLHRRHCPDQSGAAPGTRLHRRAGQRSGGRPFVRGAGACRGTIFDYNAAGKGNRTRTVPGPVAGGALGRKFPPDLRQPRRHHHHAHFAASPPTDEATTARTVRRFHGYRRSGLGGNQAALGRAGWQPAVSQVAYPRRIGSDKAQPAASRRYGRLAICATAPSAAGFEVWVNSTSTADNQPASRR